MTHLSSEIEHLIANDVDELTERARALQWPMNYLQLERGAFHGDILSYRCQTVQIIRTQYSRGLRCLGQSPPGHLGIAIPLQPPKIWNWHGYELTSDHFFLQTENRGIDQCRWGSFPLIIISFPFDELLAIAGQMGEDLALERLLGNDYVLQPPPPQLKAIRQTLADTFQILEQGRVFAFTPQHQTRFRQALTLQTLSLLSAPSPQANPFCRYAVAKQAEAIIQATGDRRLTVYDLCLQLHVSERTLRYAFQDVYGIGPKAYLQIYRLHRIRQTLKVSSPQETTVMAIAQQWGFWHMGQFSQDYKKLFGELPSVTLHGP